MNRFFCDELQSGAEPVLDTEESHHLVRVTRTREGDAVTLIDGRGGVASAEVIRANPKGAVVRVGEVERSEKGSRIRVCFAIPKSAAIEFLLKRATEVGVDSFQPLITRHSLSPKEWNAPRWRKILTAVCKQCQDPYFPELEEPLTLDDWLARREGRTLVLCDEADREAAPGPAPETGGVDVLIGAEGGWSPEERERLGKAGALSFGLGKNRLRAETAALVATVRTKLWLGELS